MQDTTVSTAELVTLLGIKEVEIFTLEKRIRAYEQAEKDVKTSPNGTAFQEEVKAA